MKRGLESVKVAEKGGGTRVFDPRTNRAIVYASVRSAPGRLQAYGRRRSFFFRGGENAFIAKDIYSEDGGVFVCSNKRPSLHRIDLDASVRIIEKIQTVNVVHNRLETVGNWENVGSGIMKITRLL